MDNLSVAYPAMAKTTRGQRLRLARKERLKGISLREAAKTLGTSPSTLSAQELGTRGIDPDDAERYGRILGRRPEWLLYDKGPANAEPEDEAPETPRTPIVGYVGANSSVHFFNVGRARFEEADPIEGLGDKIAALDIMDESYAGENLINWLVFFENVKRPPEEITSGPWVVETAAGSVIVTDVNPGSRKGTFHLGKVGSESAKDVKLVWGAKVRIIAPR